MNRRGFIIGAMALLAAPSIVRVSSLAPISVVPYLPTAHGMEFGTYMPAGTLYVDGQSRMWVIWNATVGPALREEMDRWTGRNVWLTASQSTNATGT